MQPRQCYLRKLVFFACFQFRINLFRIMKKKSFFFSISQVIFMHSTFIFKIAINFRKLLQSMKNVFETKKVEFPLQIRKFDIKLIGTSWIADTRDFYEPRRKYSETIQRRKDPLGQEIYLARYGQDSKQLIFIKVINIIFNPKSSADCGDDPGGKNMKTRGLYILVDISRYDMVGKLLPRTGCLGERSPPNMQTAIFTAISIIIRYILHIPLENQRRR